MQAVHTTSDHPLTPRESAMVYYKTFDEFSKAAETIQTTSPDRSRFVTQYAQGHFVFKFTDDVKCAKFKTDQLHDLKRLEKLTGTLTRNILSR